MINPVVLLAKMMELLRTILLLSLTQWVNQSNGLCSLQLIPRMHSVGVTFQCNSQCSSTFSLQNSLCGNLYNELAIQPCDQAMCRSLTRIYNLSTCITVENEITTSDMPETSTPTTIHRTETMNRNVLDNCNTNQQSTAVAVLATMIAILIVLLVIVSIALIWTCWTFKIKEAVNHKFRQHRIPSTLNATNTNQTARQLHNPVYSGDPRPMGPSTQMNQRLARDGKKAEHAYEVIPPTSPYKQHNSKQKRTSTGQAKTHNNGSNVKTNGGKPMVAGKLMVAGQGNIHNTSGGTVKVSSGRYKGQSQRQVGVASKDNERNCYPLDKDRNKQGSHMEENHYSQTRHFPKSNAIKKPENHYSQTRPKSNATRKPDESINDHVYHALDMSGENSNVHKDQLASQNVYNILEDPGDNSDIQERENEYHVLEGPGDNNDTCQEAQKIENEYHVLEGPGDKSDTNADVQEHEYYVLESITLKQVEEGEEQG